MDRFREAQHFLQLVLSTAATRENVSVANWYAGAHVTAAIGVDEAAKSDLGHGRYGKSSLAGEFWLTPDSPGWEQRDPVAINRAYREMRIGRTHYGRPVLSVDTRILQLDLAGDRGVPENGRPRWFVIPLEELPPDGVRRPLTREQRERFNTWCHRRPFAAIASQHLLTLGRAMIETRDALEE